MSSTIEAIVAELEVIDNVRITPSDSIFDKLGDNNYTFDEALSELIDNSIAARLGKTEIVIEFHVNENGKTEKMIIKDNSSGIPRDMISHVVSPAANIESKKGLNEHGFGLKASVKKLGDLMWIKTKTINEEPYKINHFSWNFQTYKCTNEEIGNIIHGTIIEIDTSKNSDFIPITKKTRNTTLKNDLVRLSLRLGARYRKLFEYFDLKLIVIENKGLNQIPNIFTENVVRVHLPFFNPYNSIKPNSAIFFEEKFVSSNGEVEALVTFGYKPRDPEDYDKINMTKPQKGSRGNPHPYASTEGLAGMDIIVHDRVIMFYQTKPLGYEYADPWRRFVMGEINFIKGVETITTKNQIVESPAIEDIYKQLQDFLKTYETRDSIVENLLGSQWLYQMRDKNDLREAEIKTDIHNFLEKSKKIMKSTMKIEREYPIENGCKVDFYVDGIPWEIKEDIVDMVAVYQLLGYMDVLGVNEGKIIGKELKPSGVHAIDKIQELYQKTITFQEIKDFV